MARFLVRVELHGGSTEDYSTLYRCMEEKGFTDEITLTENRQRRLPGGEYIFDTGTGVGIEIERVREILKSALSNLECEYSYTLAKISGSIKVYNLDEV